MFLFASKQSDCIPKEDDKSKEQEVQKRLDEGRKARAQDRFVASSAIVGVRRM